MELEFYKANGRWYVDLPTWEGSVEDLEMVEGADDFLEALADRLDKEQITLEIWLADPGIPCGVMRMSDLDMNGATYNVYNCNYYEGSVWLCNVTKFVFDGYHPSTIYFNYVQED